MQSEQIQAQIEEAKTIEQKRGVLHRAVLNLLRQNGADVTDIQARKIIDVITDYVEQAPALMAQVADAATDDNRTCIQPLLDAIERFFLEPNDIIPDQFGLAGLLDDAYLAHTLLQAISDEYESQFGKPLLPKQAFEMNSFIRRLIGEPFVSMLDEYVARTLDELSGTPDCSQMMVAIAQMELSLAKNQVRGSARVAEIIGVHI